MGRRGGILRVDLLGGSPRVTPDCFFMYDVLRISTLFLAEVTEHGAEEGAHAGHFEPTLLSTFTYFGLVIVAAFVILTLAKSGLKDRVFKNHLTCKLEQLHLFLENMAIGIIGPHGKKYVPFAMTFWIIIFFSNVAALIFPTAPTAVLSFNLGMAFISIGYVQWEGIRSNGFFGHIKHFAGPKLPLALIPISGMIFLIEIISEAMKTVSLSLRVYGNINGGHSAAEAMNELGTKLITLPGGIVTGIPFGAFLLPVKFLTCIVQALLFCLLFMVYVSLVTHHDTDHDDAHPHHDEHEVDAVLAAGH